MNCKIYGGAVHSFGSLDPNLATSWTGCTFEDKPYTDGKVYRAGFLVTVDTADGQNILFDACTLIANACKSIWFATPSDKPGYFANCTFVHKNANLIDHDFQALLGGITLSGCRFKEEFPKDTTKNWYIQAEGFTIAAAPPTVVDGPHVKWLGWSKGATGILPPTPAP